MTDKTPRSEGSDNGDEKTNEGKYPEGIKKAFDKLKETTVSEHVKLRRAVRRDGPK